MIYHVHLYQRYAIEKEKPFAYENELKEKQMRLSELEVLLDLDKNRAGMEILDEDCAESRDNEQSEELEILTVRTNRVAS